MRNKRCERRLACASAAAVSFLREKSWNARKDLAACTGGTRHVAITPPCHPLQVSRAPAALSRAGARSAPTMTHPVLTIRGPTRGDRARRSRLMSGAATHDSGLNSNPTVSGPASRATVTTMTAKGLIGRAATVHRRPTPPGGRRPSPRCWGSTAEVGRWLGLPVQAG
jgi:hypothetical protein